MEDVEAIAEGEEGDGEVDGRWVDGFAVWKLAIANVQIFTEHIRRHLGCCDVGDEW